MNKTPLECKNGITIVSNKKINNRRKFFHNRNVITYRQNVSAAELYGENTIHIVPIWNAVGIKNKVVEPASLGLRVLAASPSFNGLICYNHMKSVSKKSDFFPALNITLRENFENQKKNLQIIEFDQTSKLMQFLSDI